MVLKELDLRPVLAILSRSLAFQIAKESESFPRADNKSQAIGRLIRLRDLMYSRPKHHDLPGFIPEKIALTTA